MDKDKPEIFIENGILMTTSKEDARIFGKRHKHVMRDIRELAIPAHFRRSNFGFMEIIEEKTGNLILNKSYFMVFRGSIMILMMGNAGGFQFPRHTRTRARS